MKRIVSFKEFMTVIGLGIWQAICFVGRAFNYKNKTPFWRIIWGVLTACAVVFTCIFVYLFYDNEIKPKMNNEGSVLSLSDVIYSYIPDDSYSYSIWNRKTGKEIIKDVDWYVQSADNDSLVVYTQYGKRGYFNSKTGEIVIPPIYKKAWIFSDGLAAVLKADSLYFINPQGKQVLKYRYYRNDSYFLNGAKDYCFHDGLCAMYDGNKKYGIIDKSGKWVVAPEYDKICRETGSTTLFVLKKDDRYGFADIQGKIISPCLYEDVAVTEDGVFVFLDDHTQHKMNEDGTLTKDFVCYNISNLEYYVDSRINDEGEEIAVTKFANLHSYSVTTGYMGLIDNNGRRITPPMYKAIKAVGPDLYRCGYDSQLDNSVLINGKGEVLPAD